VPARVDWGSVGLLGDLGAGRAREGISVRLRRGGRIRVRLSGFRESLASSRQASLAAGGRLWGLG
jgi:hypothetical protein